MHIKVDSSPEAPHSGTGLGMSMLLMAYAFLLATLAVIPAGLPLKVYSLLNNGLDIRVSYLVLSRAGHMAAFAVLALLSAGFIFRSPAKSVPILLLATLTFEGVQNLIPTRTATLEDLSMNLLGLLAGATVGGAFFLLRRRRERQ